MDGEWKCLYTADKSWVVFLFICIAFCCHQKSRQSAYENEEDFSVKYNNNSGKSKVIFVFIYYI